MQTTITIDKDIFEAAKQRARATGRTPADILTEVLRRGLGVEATPLPPLRNGLPQIRFDPAFDPTPDTILDLIERIERDSNFGPPLFIPVETRTWADQQAAAGYARVENIISALVQESLMRQRIWPTQNGFPQFLRRSSDDTVITLELVNKLRDDE